MWIIAKLTFKSEIWNLNFFSCVWKCLNLYQLNIIKKIKERLQTKAQERYQSLSKEEKEKKVTIWSWMLQKSLGRWRIKLVEYRKKYYRIRNNALL